jgi:putative exporter of polyketide antibiotics
MAFSVKRSNIASTTKPDRRRPPRVGIARARARSAPLLAPPYAVLAPPSATLDVAPRVAIIVGTAATVLPRVELVVALARAVVGVAPTVRDLANMLQSCLKPGV